MRSSTRLFLLAAAIGVAMALYAGRMLSAIGAVQLTFSESSFRAATAGWTPEQLAVFRLHFLFDFPFLLAYGLAGHAFFAERREPWPWRRPSRALMQRAALAAALFDAVENTFQLWLVSPQGAAPALAFAAAGAASLLKWALVACCVVGGGLLIRRGA